MTVEIRPNATPDRVAEIRAALLAPVDASPETTYMLYRDQIDDLYEAIVAARKESAYAVYDVVVPLLDHPEAEIREQAVATLGFLSQTDAERSERLAPRAAALWVSDPDALVRARALRVWSQPYRNTADAVVLVRLAAILYDEGEDAFVRQEANNAILETSGALDRIRSEDLNAAWALMESSETTEPNVDWALIESVLHEAGIGEPPGRAERQ